MQGSPTLFSASTQAIFFNLKKDSIQRMLDFDFLCRREKPSVAAIVTPGSQAGSFHKEFFGTREIAIPVLPSTQLACELHPNADVFLNFASFRSAFESSMVALDQPTIRTVVIIAEGVPERNVKELIAKANKLGKVVIGPATVGGVQAGAFKIGDTAGTVENIVRCKLHRPGSVGFVSKSGGLSNEMYNVLARTTDGLFEGIAVGGDAYPGTTLTDHVLRFEKIPQIRMIVVLGELGGVDEYGIVDAMNSGKITKPLIAWVSGTCAKFFQSSEVQFGHAGAKSGSADESADAKNSALRNAGALVPSSFEGFADMIAKKYQELVHAGKIVPVQDVEPQTIPTDLSSAVKSGNIRMATSIVCTISDDRGEEPRYMGLPISQVISDGLSIGDVVSLLWFKKLLPKWATKFMEMCIVIAADHGPCVSGAHNTIVTARAGKDLVSSLCSGLLTIGPRFGGAITMSSIHIKHACDSGQEAWEFVEEMKAKGQRVEGIGHRIKNAENRDKRVLLLSEYAEAHFPNTHYLQYANAVEAYTLTKAPNLVLNIDGCIGALMCDLLCTCGAFTSKEVDEILEMDVLNGIFVLSRSIGLMGHALDQKRMHQGLYRHNPADVLYATPDDYPVRIGEESNSIDE
eukprot:ANDGO_06800.mRNA.1 ATP-citrate synthase beta chain protein 1